MPQHTARRLAARRDFSNELYFRRVQSFGFCERALHAIDHGLETEITTEGLARLRLNIAYGSANLVVGIAADVLHQKVDQTRIALENSENLNGSVGGPSGGLWRSGRSGGLYGDRLGVATSLSDIGWERA
jgi:hypothetical protein